VRHPRIIIASISLAAAAALGGGITAAAAASSSLGRSRRTDGSEKQT
jgi:hypothetical protein